MTARIAILLSGGGSNMVSLVKAMQSEQIMATPVVVLSNISSAGGLIKARNLGVATEAVDHKPFGDDRASYERMVTKTLQHYEPDIICLAGFMRILTSEFVDAWAGKMVNIHPSLLPKYKGLRTHQRAIDAKDIRAGCSVHWVTTELDGGPVIDQESVPIVSEDTADTLAARVLAQEHILYPRALARVVNTL